MHAGRKFWTALCIVALAASFRMTAQEQILLRHPYLQNVREGSATILWTTSGPGVGAVQYSADQSFSQVANSRVRLFPRPETFLDFPYYQHEAELNGLSANTEYSYRLVWNGQIVAAGGELRFRTAGPGPFNFLVLGDSGLGSPEQRTIAQLMFGENASFLVHTGDLAYPSGNWEQFDLFYFPYYWPLMQRIPFFPTPGNHEYETDDAAPYMALHAVPTSGVPPEGRGRYYSFDWGNAHFISLDTNIPLRAALAGNGPMLRWLREDLEKARQFWRVVYFHHAPYATGLHEEGEDAVLIRAHVVPILEQYDVELVLNGHEHSYQRSYPIRQGARVENGGMVYVTSGGGGGRVYPVDKTSWKVAFAESAYHYVRGEVTGTRLLLRAIGRDGKLFDATVLSPPPMISSATATGSAATGPLVRIFGRHLAGTAISASPPFPIALSGTTVTLNGAPLPVRRVSSTLVEAQLAAPIPAGAILHLSSGNGSSEISTVASPQRFFTSADPSGLLMKTTGSSEVINIGWARMQATSSGQIASGLGIFDFRQGDVMITEASVPASPAVQSARLPAEIDDRINTGLAIANPNDKPVTLSFYFTDLEGNDLSHGTAALPAQGQIARFLNQEPFNGSSAFNGTFTFTSDLPVAAIALRTFLNERKETLITTLPVVKLGATAQESMILSQFADGGGWTTSIVLVNATDAVASGQIEFMGEGSQEAPAAPVTVTLEGRTDNKFVYTLPSRSSRHLHTAGLSGITQVGSVRISPLGSSATPSILGIMTFRNGGFTTSAAAVPALRPSRTFRLFAEILPIESVKTGVAIANPSSEPATVVLEMTTLAGAPTGISDTITVPAHGQIARSLLEFPGLETIPLPFQGTLKISTQAPGGVSVVALRSHVNEREEYFVSTVPPEDEATAVSSRELFFPHFVDGGGYTTQFILTSHSSGQLSTGIIQFFGQAGQSEAIKLWQKSVP